MKPLFIIGLSLMIFGATAQTPSKIEKKSNYQELRTAAQQNKAEALSNDYTFSVSTGTYSDLAGATSVNNGQIWDDPEYIIPIGFNFQLFDLNIDSLYFGLGLGGMVSSKVDTNFEYIILPFETDLLDRGDLTGASSKSPISYKVEGTSGSRIFKLEWKNAGFYDEADSLGTLNDYVNFQLWLYEGTNAIEMHYGPHMISDPLINYFGETGAIVGLTNYSLTNVYLLSGAPGSPMVMNFYNVLNGTPADGTIYTFTKVNTVGTGKELTTAALTVFPNPMVNEAKIKTNNFFKDAVLTVFDASGQVARQETGLAGQEITLLRNGLPAGLYYVQLSENGQVVATEKIIIKN